ncbi:MAG: DUF3089 domain-containing protein [Saprospiraceae bacterium]|nr:DUF3089 domain-containing protein [Saprospiraceae bacterium]
MKRNFRFWIYGLMGLFMLSSCAATKPKNAFEYYTLPDSPNYALPENWAAWPGKKDLADTTPLGLRDQQQISQADVFFIHPTSFLNKRGHDQWNAEINNSKVNQITDEGAIQYQATIFNEVGRIYAPRYRQAHFEAFFTEDTASARKSLLLAYTDVKAAFDYFLEKENQGRPIILAGHSQGALHMIRLLQDYFDKPDSMRNKLVVAYAVGWPIPKDEFRFLKACEYPEGTGCICSWRSFKMGHKPKHIKNEAEVIITNPLNWKTTEDYISKEFNLGAVLDGFDKSPVIGMSGARIYKGILWVDKPKFKFSFLYPFANFHRGDLNIFYMNVRENVKTRLNSFWR